MDKGAAHCIHHYHNILVDTRSARPGLRGLTVRNSLAERGSMADHSYQIDKISLARLNFTGAGIRFNNTLLAIVGEINKRCHPRAGEGPFIVAARK